MIGSRIKILLAAVLLTVVSLGGAQAKPDKPAATPAEPVVAATVATKTDSAYPGKIVLLSGSPIQLALVNTLASNKSSVDDKVEYVVTEEVKAENGALLIRKGARGTGKITLAKKAKMFGKKGKLEFTLEEVEAVDGTIVPLRSDVKASGKGRGVAVVTVTVLVSVLGVFIKGKNVTVPQGTVVSAYVDSDTVIAPSKTNEVGKERQTSNVERSTSNVEQK